MNALSSDLLTGSYTGASQLSLSLIPGVWLCSYTVRTLSNASNSNVSNFNAYISLPVGITNVSPAVVAYSAYSFNPGTVTISTVGLNNLSLTGSGVVTTTTTQTITLTLAIAATGTSYYNGTQTYIMATRIA